jgi:cobalt-zinc-cadmium efflux system membrane fusion protein
MAVALLLLATTACGRHDADKAKSEDAEAASAKPDGDIVKLTPAQIETAGIELVRPTVGKGSGVVELPGAIAGDPQSTQVVSAAIGGRVVELSRNLGQAVERGQTLAVIESREAAQLKGEVEATRARLALANSSLAREERLFAERVTPEQDVLTARTGATEAKIAYRQAQQQVAASGGGGGALNRLAVTAPISGQVISRTAVLGQMVAADAELYRVAKLGQVSVSLSLSPADAGRVRPGGSVTVTASGRQASGRLTFVSPALDAETKLVPAIASLDNRTGQWRIGESVTVAVDLVGGGGSTVKVPSTAVQTIEGKTVVFVRTLDGFKATPVTVGQSSGETVIVTKGLGGREQIAAGNSFSLKSALGAKADED